MPLEWNPKLNSMPEQVQINKDDIEQLKKDVVDKAFYPKGEYDATVTYNYRDVVVDNSQVYIHMADYKTLGVPPSDTSVWTLIDSTIIGPVGPEGPQGPRGSQFFICNTEYWAHYIVGRPSHITVRINLRDVIPENPQVNDYILSPLRIGEYPGHSPEAKYVALCKIRSISPPPYNEAGCEVLNPVEITPKPGTPYYTPKAIWTVSKDPSTQTIDFTFTPESFHPEPSIEDDFFTTFYLKYNNKIYISNYRHVANNTILNQQGNAVLVSGAAGTPGRNGNDSIIYSGPINVQGTSAPPDVTDLDLQYFSVAPKVDDYFICTLYVIGEEKRYFCFAKVTSKTTDKCNAEIISSEPITGQRGPAGQAGTTKQVIFTSDTPVSSGTLSEPVIHGQTYFIWVDTIQGTPGFNTPSWEGIVTGLGKGSLISHLNFSQFFRNRDPAADQCKLAVVEGKIASGGSSDLTFTATFEGGGLEIEEYPDITQPGKVKTFSYHDEPLRIKEIFYYKQP